MLEDLTDLGHKAVTQFEEHRQRGHDMRCLIMGRDWILDWIIMVRL